MRVLKVTNGYPPRAYGGVELHTHRLCGALRARGHDMFVFTRYSDLGSPDGTLCEEEIDGVRVWSVVNDHKRGRFRDYYWSDEVGARFDEALAAFRPDVVHFQHLVGLSADLPQRARARGLRVVATMHEYWYVCQRAMFQHRDGEPCRGPAHASCVECMVGARGSNGTSRPERAASPLASMALVLARRGARWPVPAVGPPENRERFAAFRDAIAAYERITTPSRFVVDELARHGMPLPAERTQVIALGVDRSPFGSPAPVGDLPIRAERPLRVGFIGQHLHHKGPHTLLEALRLLPGRPIEVHTYGKRWPDHPYDAGLRHLFEAESRARYFGRFADGELPRVLASFDVLAVPSTCPESFGIATREAFLAGRPVLSTDRGALPESIRPEVDGFLVPGEDPSAMAEALRRLVDEPELLPRLIAGALRARDSVKSMDAYAGEIETELYRTRPPGEISSNAST